MEISRVAKKDMFEITILFLEFIILAFSYDIIVFQWLDNFSFKIFMNVKSVNITNFITFATNIGGTKNLAFFTLMIGLFLIVKKYISEAIFLITTMIGVGLSNYFLKLLFFRNRPSYNDVLEVSTSSFPSGHTIGIIAILILISRVYL